MAAASIIGTTGFLYSKRRRLGSPPEALRCLRVDPGPWANGLSFVGRDGAVFLLSPGDENVLRTNAGFTVYKAHVDFFEEMNRDEDDVACALLGAPDRCFGL